MNLTATTVKRPQVLYYQRPIMRTVVCVDLGFSRDHTAIAVLEEREYQTDFDPVYYGYKWEKKITVRYLERLPLGTTYTDVAARIKEVEEMVNDRGASGREGEWPSPGVPRPSAVVVDATGLGMPMVHLLRKEGLHAPVVPVIFTSGDQATRDKDVWRVPKQEIVTNAQILLEQHILRFPGMSPESGMLIKEMEQMRVKVSAHGNEQFGCWREGEHDDLVLAVAMGAWWLCRGA